jgi:mRNA interferase YafQ
MKLVKKRGKNLAKLQEAIFQLSETGKVDSKYFDHALIGNYVGRRECHIESDWLLIYKIDGNTIIFERTGSHADLFKK